MSCTNPMLMSVLDLKNARMDFYYRLRELGWKVSIPDKKAYRLVAKSSRDHVLEHIPDYINQNVIEVPCGNCIACRLKYSLDWANRCTLEAQKYPFNYFITLTYDDEHLSKGIYGNATINKENVSQFLKALRQKFKRVFNHTGIKYFGCAEYGDRTFRPHLHILLFNCPIPDLTPDFKDENGQITHHKCGTGVWYQYSQFIKDLWPYGNILVADCNWNTSAYVSRYVLKKQKGQNAEVYDKLGVTPPYVYMSTRPGIGLSYFKDHKDALIDSPYIIVPRDHKMPLVSGLPRYYKKQIKKEDPGLYGKMVDKAKDSILKTRSLIKGKQFINDKRSAEENNIKSKAQAFCRDF